MDATPTTTRSPVCSQQKDRYAEYHLNACLATHVDGAFFKGLGNIARHRGMADIAATCELTEKSLYKALSENGNPGFSNVRRVLAALGLDLVVVPQSLTTHMTK